MENINNIRFGINEDFVEFWYFQNNEEKTAYLQLPDTPDSIHQINNINSDEWYLKDDENGQCEEREIFSILLKHYSESFKNNGEFAAASAECGTEIEHIEEVIYNGTTIYVAYDHEENTSLLIDSRFKDYYNKGHLFDKLDRSKQFEVFGEGLEENKIIEKATEQRIIAELEEQKKEISKDIYDHERREEIVFHENDILDNFVESGSIEYESNLHDKIRQYQHDMIADLD